ncbi:hypothetical protein BDN72DRAFT_898767 [Pluteus cervinus]|uniref:Uncharacterized protein n=1 Tax=Pluteus cervinus TaxID=181527 RepID=A0ACD3AP07_9AGAR|nr:hypothetical protein BDN72DRAFT_898767 [Pluteus cervinus]
MQRARYTFNSVQISFSRQILRPHPYVFDTVEYRRNTIECQYGQSVGGSPYVPHGMEFAYDAPQPVQQAEPVIGALPNVDHQPERCVAASGQTCYCYYCIEEFLATAEDQVGNPDQYLLEHAHQHGNVGINTNVTNPVGYYDEVVDPNAPNLYHSYDVDTFPGGAPALGGHYLEMPDHSVYDDHTYATNPQLQVAEDNHVNFAQAQPQASLPMSVSGSSVYDQTSSMTLPTLPPSAPLTYENLQALERSYIQPQGAAYRFGEDSTVANPQSAETIGHPTKVSVVDPTYVTKANLRVSNSHDYHGELDKMQRKKRRFSPDYEGGGELGASPRRTKKAKMPMNAA